MSIQSEIDRINSNVQAALNAVADAGVSVPEGANSDNLPAAVSALANEKQDKLTGAQGQIVGFGPDGKAVAQDKPTYAASEVGAIPTTEKGAANGVATLGADALLAAAQRPKAGGLYRDDGNTTLEKSLTDISTTLQKKADSSDVYTKDEVDTLFQEKTQSAVLNVVTNAGVVVTATKGSKVLSATADSSGLAVFKIPTFGIWTVTVSSVSKTINIDAIAVFYLVMHELESLSWSQVALISKMGLASTQFHIGDEKTLTVNGVSYTAVIIGFDHDTPVDTSTYGRDKVGITWQLKNCLNTTYKMNSSGTNSGGWTSCEMRTSTMATLLSQLASDLKNAIVKVKKLSSEGGQSTTINTTEDSLFLLSEVEIFGHTDYAKEGEGSQYEYYQSGNSCVKTANGSASDWWERSPRGSLSTTFCCVSSSGYTSNEKASESLGVSFAFCV